MIKKYLIAFIVFYALFIIGTTPLFYFLDQLSSVYGLIFNQILNNDYLSMISSLLTVSTALLGLYGVILTITKISKRSIHNNFLDIIQFCIMLLPLFLLTGAMFLCIGAYFVHSGVVLENNAATANPQLNIQPAELGEVLKEVIVLLGMSTDLIVLNIMSIYLSNLMEQTDSFVHRLPDRWYSLLFLISGLMIWIAAWTYISFPFSL
jgi:hypothetical protein